MKDKEWMVNGWMVRGEWWEKNGEGWIVSNEWWGINDEGWMVRDELEGLWFIYISRDRMLKSTNALILYSMIKFF